MKILWKAAWKILKRNKLQIDTQVCVRCGLCFNVCNHQAIKKMHDNQYEILTEKCHRCYHCKEQCPKQAIKCVQSNK